MTDRHLLTFSAVDTLMFRDGRPFNQADAGAARAVSIFPPHPPSLVGAVRAALWRQLGGRKEDWKTESLGNGTNWQGNGTELGSLAFGPPLVLHDDKPIFPVPLHIVTSKEGLTWLKPGPERDCDLGQARLPVAHEPFAGIKPIEDQWVTLAGLKVIADGHLPMDSDLVDAETLWQSETRVGIGRDRETRGVVRSQLYMASHIRMGENVSLGIEVSGFPDSIANVLTPLAGPRRIVMSTTFTL